jgi:TetR/AcrR family transcriptional regulator, ethionamide resistance regulator
VTGPPLSSRGRRVRRPSGDDRERAILNTAERLLADQSPQEISVDDLARGAGISRPTFYFYFPSKEAVVLSLLDRMVLEVRSAFDAALDRAAGDSQEMWRQGLEAIHDAFRSHLALSRTATHLSGENAEVRLPWSGLMAGFADDTAAAIESERAHGAAPPGPPARDLAIALNSMTERTFLASLSGWDPSIGEGRVLDCVLTIWSRAIYGDDRLVESD